MVADIDLYVRIGGTNTFLHKTAEFPSLKLICFIYKFTKLFIAMRRFKPTYSSYHFLQNLIKHYRLKCSLQKQNQIYAISITTCVAVLRDVFVGREKPIYDDRHFVQPPEPDLIQRADDLYVQNRYVEVYELLNQLKFCSNVEVLWRMSRALFAMSHTESLTKIVREEMINEAYQLIRAASIKQDNNANVHKWMAILLDSTAAHVGTYARTKTLPEVKKHLLRATELNPTDVTTLYMLGHWCYQLANLTWFQRKLASILYAPPPLSSFEEAYDYFLKAEQLKPRFFIGNTYMLGKVSFHMKQCYRAKYYLDIAASLPHRTEREKQYMQEARRLSTELQQYDLSKSALFHEG